MCCVFVCVLFVNECVMLYGLVFEVLLAFACAIINVCVVCGLLCAVVWVVFCVFACLCARSCLSVFCVKYSI